jgi:hypothetical protein
LCIKICIIHSTLGKSIHISPDPIKILVGDPTINKETNYEIFFSIFLYKMISK